MIDKEALLTAANRPKVVEVENFGTVGFRLLGATDLMRLRDVETGEDKTPVENIKAMAAFLGCVLCDEGGRLLFNGDASRLEELPIELLANLVKIGQEHNGIAPDQREADRKNSEGEPTSDSM